MTEIEFFWLHVERRQPDQCWRWKGRPVNYGYGRFSFRKQTDYAHRVAFRLTHGPIPSAAVVLHTCDNPICVNPAHLRAGSQADNLADMHAKGRYRKPRAGATSCMAGHPYTPKNTFLRRSGGRVCRVCKRRYERMTRHALEGKRIA